MALGLLGKKVGTTQGFGEDGQRLTLTVVEAGPCVVTQRKTEESDGYSALQVGYQEIDKRKAGKPMLGHTGKCGKGPFRFLREFRLEDAKGFEPGQRITLEIFQKGDLVDVTGRSKGKGFQGTVKRHHFTRGPMSHGSKNKRAPGSIGSSAFPSRVIKGKRMPGHMGDRTVTVQNLKVWSLEPENNLLFIVGNVPGANNGLLIIRPSVKSGRTGAKNG